MADNDSQDDLKRRARRRLVGAAALALFAAIVLPMVMDEEPRPLTQDVQIRIPSQESGSFASRLVPAAPGEAAADKPAQAVEPPPPGDAGKPETAPAAASPRVEPAAPAPAPLADPKEADKAAETGRETMAQAEMAAKVERARVEAILNGRSGEQWIVQLGAFRNPANARQLRAKLKSEGYDSYTEAFESAGKARTRVRAGPFPTRDAAEKARDKLKRIGLNGVVAQKQ